MQNAHLVLITADYDCDGVSIAAHRVAVPASRAQEFLSNHRALRQYAVNAERLSGYYDCVVNVLTAQSFLSGEDFWSLDKWDRDYFREVGYASLGSERSPDPDTYETTADLDEAIHYEKIEADLMTYAVS